MAAATVVAAATMVAAAIAVAQGQHFGPKLPIAIYIMTAKY